MGRIDPYLQRHSLHQQIQYLQLASSPAGTVTKHTKDVVQTVLPYGKSRSTVSVSLSCNISW